MVDLTLICVGKMKEKFYSEAAAEYVKRLGGYCKLSIVEIPEQRLSKNPSLGEIQGALEREGDAIRSKIPANSSVVALAIGGSYGLHPSVKAGAWCSLSMSPMTFPHHLARVMLLEQIYRAFKIQEGADYHK